MGWRWRWGRRGGGGGGVRVGGGGGGVRECVQGGNVSQEEAAHGECKGYSKDKGGVDGQLHPKDTQRTPKGHPKDTQRNVNGLQLKNKTPTHSYTPLRHSQKEEANESNPNHFIYQLQTHSFPTETPFLERSRFAILTSCVCLLRVPVDDWSEGNGSDRHQ